MGMSDLSDNFYFRYAERADAEIVVLGRVVEKDDIQHGNDALPIGDLDFLSVATCNPFGRRVLRFIHGKPRGTAMVPLGSGIHVMRQAVRRPRVISSRVLIVCGAGCRRR